MPNGHRLTETDPTLDHRGTPAATDVEIAPPTTRAVPRSPKLRADCTKCCAICCVAPPFDANQGFGFDKAAHSACSNLRTNLRCGIHDGLRSRGFPACASFDCYGAGQRVTQHLFGGRSWQSSPQVALQMFNAYFRYRALHELMALLEMAIQRVSPRDALQLREQLRFIDGLCESGTAAADTVRIDAIRKDVLSRVRVALRGDCGGGA